MKVEFVSKQVIKPSSPTPQNLRNYKLSFMDQLAAAVNVPILFFYPNIEYEGHIIPIPSHYKIDHDDRCERLKKSLSETLTDFYPLAGRVKDNAIIECNDEGVKFCEAHFHGLLFDILVQLDADSLQQFVPNDDDDDVELGSGFLLKVQANLFECGSLVIGVSVSHKFADATTDGLFLKAWCWKTAGRIIIESMLPKYNLESRFPSMDFSNIVPQPWELRPFDCVTRRYVLDSSNITKLKAKASSKLVEKPTRVEAVLALIWRCSTTASRTNLGITRRPSKVCQTVNIRKMTNPPLPENSVGNCLSTFIVQAEETNNSSTNMDLQMLVAQLREGLQQFLEKCSHELREGNNDNAFSMLSERWKDIELAAKEDVDFYLCSSWCRFEYYEADFGWGKPKWVSATSLKIRNSIILMDTSDGKGIEAWVTLSEQDMALLDSNHELLEFASLNPTII